MSHERPIHPVTECMPWAHAGEGWRRLPLLLALVALVAVTIGLHLLAEPAVAATITVNITDDEDSDPDPGTGCSLREAIVAANDDQAYGGCVQGDPAPTVDVILFSLGAVPAPDPHQILLPADDLPAITGAVTIDGWSAITVGTLNDYAGPPVVWITPDPGAQAEVGLEIIGDQVEIRGLAISDFGANIEMTGDGTHKVVGSYIGGRPVLSGSGLATVSNQTAVTPPGCGCGNFVGIDVIGEDTPDVVYPLVTIGGKGAGEGNVIVGHTDVGIQLFLLEGATAVGNFIGTDRAGNTLSSPDNVSLGNYIGIAIEDTFDITVGDGTVEGRNVISGNIDTVDDLGTGIFVSLADGTSIKGNYIGVKPNGTEALPNDYGIFILDSIDTDIGGTTPGSRNIISGNTVNGIEATGVCSCGGLTTQIRGNYIGLDSTGTSALGNGENGVLVYQGSGIVVGGSFPGEGNVVSGNGEDGISIVGFLSGAIEVAGNRVGTNAAGTAALGNENDGISMLPDVGFGPGPFGSLIGGHAQGTGNLVSGNGRHGIYLLDASDGSILGPVELENLVTNNAVGVDVNGTGAIPNQGSGIAVVASVATFVFENVVANNAQAGVLVEPLGMGAPGTIVVTNSIYNNGGLGIDLTGVVTDDDGDGVTENDSPDADGVQNFPVVTTAATSSALAVLGGTITTTPDTGVHVELFASPSCDPSGNGEGRTFVGSVDVFTDGAGRAAFNKTVAPLTPDHWVTATASTPDLATSEFSDCWKIGNAAILVSPTSGLTTTDAGGQATFTVVLASAPIADVSIALSSSDTTEGTVSPTSLVFTPANALVPRTVTVTGVSDGVADGSQNFTIVTAAATSADPLYNNLDAPDVAVVSQDTTVPSLSIEAAGVTEGTGSSVPISFTARLSAISTQTVHANWQVVNGTAQLGSDLELTDAAGGVVFNPGEVTKPIVVRVIGDSVPEPTETFTVRLFESAGASIGAPNAIGTILDDDVAAGPCSPRPNVVMTTTRSGTDQLAVSVKAGVGTIEKITFGSAAQPMQNAQVETVGPASVIQGFGVLTLPPGVIQQTFVVRRIVPNQPVMVTLVIEDDCGEWKTFIGTGQNPW